jgi:hypothetical protein
MPEREFAMNRRNGHIQPQSPPDASADQKPPNSPQWLLEGDYGLGWTEMSTGELDALMELAEAIRGLRDSSVVQVPREMRIIPQEWQQPRPSRVTLEMERF